MQMESAMMHPAQSGNLPTLHETPRLTMSPGRHHTSLIPRKSFQLVPSPGKPRDRLPSKQQLVILNEKISLIKNKCMRAPGTLGNGRSHQSTKGDQEQDPNNDSVDLDEEDDVKKTQSQSKKGHLIRSKFPDRPATLFFKYPKCCGIEETPNDRVCQLEKPNLTYKIVGSQYKCIVNSLEYNGFVQVEGGSDWNVFFDITGIHMKALETMNRFQKLNHFPGCWHLGRKDSLYKHLNKQRRSHPDAYNFVPVTYIFPSDYDRFEMNRQNASQHQLWIMKPTNQACGRGIKMVTKDTPIKNRPNVLVSEYVANPHLINNFKYDLRIYVLVTSYDPLRIYMFQEGLTRFATYEYSNSTKEIKKKFIHLTNFSINKHSKKFVKNSKAEEDGQGSKWSLTALKKHYDQNGIDSTKLFDSIKDVIIKTCISAEPLMLDIHSKTQEKRSCGFEIYGFDILIDDKLKPWLMEVNVCPSLSSSSPMDRRIKHTLLTDILNIVGLEHYSAKTYQIDKRREKQRQMKGNDRRFFSKNLNSLNQLDYSNCIEMLSPEDWQVLFESQEELHRAGHFERIFPTRNNIDKYARLFEFNRYNNLMLWKNLKSDRNFIDKLYH